MRHSMNSQWDVLCAWSRQDREHAYSGNVSFRDGNLFSYSTQIARILENPKVALITNYNYSVTTARHKYDARRACCGVDIPVFEVPSIDGDHKENVNYFIDELRQTVVAFDRSRHIHRARDCIRHNETLCAYLRRYCRFFGLKLPVLLGLEMDMSMPHIRKRFTETGTVDRWGNKIEIFVPVWLADLGFENVEAKHVLKTRNAEIRRAIIRKIGIENVLTALGAQVIDKRGDYELVSLNLRDGRKRPYLKMRNPSVGVWHVEDVHPAISTVQDALNYRYYGDELFVPIVEQAKEEVIEEENSSKSNWRIRAERRAELGRHPEQRQIRCEYRTSELIPNVNDWNPEILT